MRRAVVIGAAANALEDIAQLELIARAPLEDAFRIYAVNDGGVLWNGRIDAWVTIHSDELPERQQRRRAAGGPDGYVTWTHQGAADRIIGPDWAVLGGTSALLAASVARLEGCDFIVLVGCPMTDMGYTLPHVNHGTGNWPHHATYRGMIPSLVKQHPWLTERIRSMSGFTAEIFGKPSKEWLNMDDLREPTSPEPTPPTEPEEAPAPEPGDAPPAEEAAPEDPAAESAPPAEEPAEPGPDPESGPEEPTDEPEAAPAPADVLIFATDAKGQTHRAVLVRPATNAVLARLKDPQGTQILVEFNEDGGRGTWRLAE